MHLLVSAGLWSREGTRNGITKLPTCIFLSLTHAIHRLLLCALFAVSCQVSEFLRDATIWKRKGWWQENPPLDSPHPWLVDSVIPLSLTFLKCHSNNNLFLVLQRYFAVIKYRLWIRSEKQKVLIKSLGSLQSHREGKGSHNLNTAKSIHNHLQDM